MPSQPLWRPSDARISQSNMLAYARFLDAEYGQLFPDYAALHQWSVTCPEDFWRSIWDFTGIRCSEFGPRVRVDGARFPGARWFPDARLNFAENLLRRRDDAIALVGRLENGVRRTLTHAELHDAVARVAAGLRARGLTPGDRVAAFMPNVPETLIAMLATASIGAVWSSCSPDFGITGVLDRFGQIAPKVLFACDGYHYNGKAIDTAPRVGEIAAQIPSIETLVLVPVLDAGGTSDLPGALPWDALTGSGPVPELHFEQLPFAHPLYILYSSGTTGVPKCIVHSAGGTLLQHLKEHRLHVDLKPTDTLFYFTTCGWMMWNWLASGLATGATLVLYDGSPFHPAPDALIDLIDLRRHAARQPPPGAPAHNPLDRLAAVSRELPLRLPGLQRRSLPRIDLRRHRHRVLLRARQSLSAGVGGRDPVPGSGHGRRYLERRRRDGCAPSRFRPAPSASGTIPMIASSPQPISRAGPASGPRATTARSPPTAASSSTAAATRY